MRTQVGIVGAGPAGLVLARLLHRAGIDAVILERRTRSYVENRLRAGVLEHGTAELLDDIGAGARMRREGLVHSGIELRFGGEAHRIDLAGLTGKTITVYGQQEVVKDLIAARLADDLPLHFGAEVTGVDGTTLEYRQDGVRQGLECDFIVGCDGSHGLVRHALPAGALRTAERVHPYAWLGILARSPAAAEELVYAYHERGFALHSMRTPDVIRLYLQVPTDTDLAQWPDRRIWEELRTRLDLPLKEGEVLERGVTAMRSFAVEPMRHDRLFLAGDAAHIVPPTGAKGMNLAISDVRVLAEALTAYYADGTEHLLDAYSPTCLKRVWQVQRFSNWMTTMLHRHEGDDEFGHRVQLAELQYVTGSTAAATTLAENYVGLPR